MTRVPGEPGDIDGRAILSENAKPEEAHPAEFEDLLDFLSVAFVEDDFRRIHPRLYRPQFVNLNCVVRASGRIRSSAMLVPHTWFVGETRLQAAGIGGVATHPRTRGQGLMQAVVSHQLNRAQEGGFDLAFLGGQRQRYNRFGFETSGNCVRLLFTQAGARAEALRVGYPTGLSFRQIRSQDLAAIERAMMYHGRQSLRSDRGNDPQEFYLFLKAWRNKPFAAVDDHGLVVGILVVAGGDFDAKVVVTELLAETPIVASAMLRAWLERSESVQELQLLLPPTDLATARELSNWAERSEVTTTECAAMFLIIAWDRVVDAMLKLRLRMLGCLAPASVVIQIVGYGRLLLCVSDAGKSAYASRLEDRGAHPEDAPDEIWCDSRMATRLLFGPLSPMTVMPLPPVVAGALSAWCPLPLYWATQDAV